MHWFNDTVDAFYYRCVGFADRVDGFACFRGLVANVVDGMHRFADAVEMRDGRYVRFMYRFYRFYGFHD